MVAKNSFAFPWISRIHSTSTFFLSTYYEQGTLKYNCEAKETKSLPSWSLRSSGRRQMILCQHLCQMVTNAMKKNRVSREDKEHFMERIAN